MSEAKLELIARLADESHFGISIRACRACGQRCVTVFTETIDWEDGEDPQYFSILPLTAEESDSLMREGKNMVARIESLGRNRRYLQIDHPKDGPRRVLWANGRLWIGPHD